MRKLVVTADDVGLHPGMTRGALAAADAGIVTAVSVSTVGRDFTPAVEQLLARRMARRKARRNGGPDVGVHLTLVGERPLSLPERIPSLVGRDGAFLSGYPALAARYALGRLAGREVEAELRLQIERLLRTGLPVLHANSHQHLHLLPRLFEIVLRLAEEHAIPFVRIPREPALGFPWTSRRLQLAALNHLGRRARRCLAARGESASAASAACAGTPGLLDAGRLTVERIRRTLSSSSLGGAAPAWSELACHPGIGDLEIAAAYGWGYRWDRETAALCDPGLPALFASAGVELTSFSALLL